MRCLALAIPFAVLVPIAARAAETPRPIVITVDDLPIASARLHSTPDARTQVTRGLLAALAKHRIKAVGLVTGRNVTAPSDERLLEAWLKDGHELGNHSFTHPSFTATDVEAYVADMEKARAWLATFLEARQQRLRFFRFPFLREGDTKEKLEAMRAYLARSGQQNLPVTLDNQDWSFEEPWVEAVRAGDKRRQQEIGADYLASIRLAVKRHERLSDRLFERPVPQILLLHANAVGAAHWDDLFTWLAASGRTFVAADDALADAAYAEAHDYVGPYGFGLWDRIAVARRTRDAQAEITALLGRQADAWNAGDIDGFAAAYAADARLATAVGVVEGREAVLERYRELHPEADARGRLRLEALETRLAAGTEVTPAGDAVPSRVHGASVLVQWTLQKNGAESSGLTLLVLRPIGTKWEIVHEATL